MENFTVFIKTDSNIFLSHEFFLLGVTGIIGSHTCKTTASAFRDQ